MSQEPSAHAGIHGSHRKIVYRGEKRRQELAEIAKQVFLEKGFSTTTMQQIAARAGASKETLYRHFGTKEGLFAEVVRIRAAELGAPIDQALPLQGNPRDVLFDAGLTCMRGLTQPAGFALFRMVVAEVPNAPELGQLFFALGPGSFQTRLAEYLRCSTVAGQLNCARPDHAASLFCAALMGNYQLKELLGIGVPIDGEDELRHHVAEVVALFLARYAIDAATTTHPGPGLHQ